MMVMKKLEQVAAARKGTVRRRSFAFSSVFCFVFLAMKKMNPDSYREAGLRRTQECFSLNLENVLAQGQINLLRLLSFNKPLISFVSLRYGFGIFLQYTKKYSYSSICVTIIILSFFTNLSGQTKCNSTYWHAPKQNISLESGYTTGVSTIPVMVHVVWFAEDENISDAQISSQFDVLNQDYRAANTEFPNIHPLFDDLAADVELEFCLVGITRTQTSIPNIYNQFNNGKRRVCYTSEGGHDALNPEQYLNIWLSARSDGALGNATAPGETVPEEDGVFIVPSYFGTTGTVSPPYHFGRTCTHEIGHYFGLQHLWGPGLENDSSCSGDDGIDDTPKQFGTYQNTCPFIPMSSCGSADMFMNFMNYTNDVCMAMFTQGQKERIQSVLQNMRAGLLEGNCAPVSTSVPSIHFFFISPNPASEYVQFTLPTNDIYTLTIFDFTGRLIANSLYLQGPHAHVSTSHLPKGNYLLNIRNGQKLYMDKILIVR